MNPDIDIVNGELIQGPHRAALAAVVEQVANDFDHEYMVRDDPVRHGRVFNVVDADAALVLRLNRNEHGRESITILAVDYYHSGMEDMPEEG